MFSFVNVDNRIYFLPCLCFLPFVLLAKKRVTWPCVISGLAVEVMRESPSALFLLLEPFSTARKEKKKQEKKKKKKKRQEKLFLLFFSSSLVSVNFVDCTSQGDDRMTTNFSPCLLSSSTSPKPVATSLVFLNFCVLVWTWLPAFARSHQYVEMKTVSSCFFRQKPFRLTGSWRENPKKREGVEKVSDTLALFGNFARDLVEDGDEKARLGAQSGFRVSKVSWHDMHCSNFSITKKNQKHSHSFKHTHARTARLVLSSATAKQYRHSGAVLVVLLALYFFFLFLKVLFSGFGCCCITTAMHRIISGLLSCALLVRAYCALKPSFPFFGHSESACVLNFFRIYVYVYVHKYIYIFIYIDIGDSCVVCVFVMSSVSFLVFHSVCHVTRIQRSPFLSFCLPQIACVSAQVCVQKQVDTSLVTLSGPVSLNVINPYSVWKLSAPPEPTQKPLTCLLSEWHCFC